jgi:ATP-dependent helicase/nuclease subunit A
MTGAMFRDGIDPIALTPDQREAADPGASAWVEASAGTGKTQVLTARVLRLLLTGAVPTRILCLTFTKAAAAEMATRIAQRLGIWTIASDDALRRDIEALGHPDTGRDTLARARRLFARVLDAPGGMHIITIHAFCQSVLQRFPLEANLAPHFTVLDEGEANALLREARDALLGAEGPQPALGDPLTGIAAWVGEDEFADLVESLARERGRLAGAIERHGGVEGLARAIRDRHGVGAVKDDAELVVAGAADGAFGRKALALAARALLEGSKTDKERGQAIADWLAVGAAARERTIDDYAVAFLTQKGDVRDRLATKRVEDGRPGTVAVLEAEAARLRALEEGRRALKVAAATEALARLGAAMLELYARRKREAGALDYDDLVHHTRLLLQRPDLPRWVLFKLDGGIDHVLIDEAQDTNPEQWAVVQALTDEFFAGAGARDGQERTVFAVGDPKQSIFGFQRADPKAFEAMRGYFENKARGAMAEFRPVALRKSFRSVPPVLRLVDAVFAGGPARDGVLAQGAVMRHEAERAGEAGLVELWPVAAAKDDEGDIEPWSPPTARTARDEPRARLANTIAERIRSWVGREELKSRGRWIGPGDVMVLVRRRDALVDELVRALKRLQIPVAGVDRMVLTEQLAVMDLMALGDFLLLPEDDLTLAAVLKGPLFGFDDDRLFKLCHGRSGRLWAALNACAAAEPGGPEDGAAEELKSLLARTDFVGPYALFAELLGARGGRRKLVARLGHDAGDPIDEFLSAALAFEREHEPSLQGFLKWLRAGAAEIKRELDQSGRDEVRIMTVHGAKGLQAPIVILPDTQQAPGKIDSVLWTESGVPLWSPRVGVDDAVAAALRADAKTARDREYRRLLYVALTRAEDRLYVTGWRGKKGASENCWYDLVAIGAARIPEAADFAWTAREGGWVGQGRRLEAPQEQAPDRLAGAAEEEPAPPLPDWATRSPEPEPEPPTPLAPSAPDEAGEPPVLSPIGAEERRRFRRGLLIHRLLQVLPELPESDRGGAAAALLKRWARDLDETARARLAEETLAVLRSPDLAGLFGPEGRAEVPVVGRIGRYVVAGQVDRLVVRPEGVIVVDFKTNRPPPREASAVPAGYVRQMAAYRAVIRRIYPGRPVRCALLWTDGAFATVLPDDLLDRADPTREKPGPPP